MAGHLLTNIVKIPTGERRERTRFLLPALRQAGAIVLGLLTRISTLPRMTQDIAPLEVAPVSGLLEHQILRKVIGVIAQVQPGEEYILPLHGSPITALGLWPCGQPEHA